MKDIDYENLFVYMSLIFAFCIFIILLYGCAFANTQSPQSPIYENFLSEDDKGDVKSQVLAILTDAETKDTTSAENKTKITDAIEKINNNNISVAELKKIINLLKDMTPTQSKVSSIKRPATETAKDAADASKDTAKDASKDTSKDTSTDTSKDAAKDATAATTA